MLYIAWLEKQFLKRVTRLDTTLAQVCLTTKFLWDSDVHVLVIL